MMDKLIGYLIRSIYLCGRSSSFLNIFRISSPSKTNSRSGWPIRPPTLAILPYCFCNEYMTLSRSCIEYWPEKKNKNLEKFRWNGRGKFEICCYNRRSYRCASPSIASFTFSVFHSLFIIAFEELSNVLLSKICCFSFRRPKSFFLPLFHPFCLHAMLNLFLNALRYKTMRFCSLESACLMEHEQTKFWIRGRFCYDEMEIIHCQLLKYELLKHLVLCRKDTINNLHKKTWMFVYADAHT